MGVDPLLRHDRGAQRELAAQHRRRDDLGELAHLARAVAPEQLQALALGGQARAAAVAGDDQRRDRDGVVVVAVLAQLGVDERRAGLRDVGRVLARRDEHRGDAVGRVGAVVVDARHEAAEVGDLARAVHDLAAGAHDALRTARPGSSPPPPRACRGCGACSPASSSCRSRSWTPGRSARSPARSWRRSTRTPPPSPCRSGSGPPRRRSCSRSACRACARPSTARSRSAGPTSWSPARPPRSRRSCSASQRPKSRASRALSNRNAGARCMRSSRIVVFTPPASRSSFMPRL